MTLDTGGAGRSRLTLHYNTVPVVEERSCNAVALAAKSPVDNTFAAPAVGHLVVFVRRDKLRLGTATKCENAPPKSN